MAYSCVWWSSCHNVDGALLQSPCLDLTALVLSVASLSTGSETSAMVAAMLTAFTELRTASGARAIGETQAREGVYEILSCKTMNGMYISLLHYLCGTMLDPVSSCALLLLFTGIILFASDVTKLCVRVKGEVGDYSSNKVGPEENSNGIDNDSQKMPPAITSEADF